MCTKFGVDSSSHFPFRARTNRQTDATERSTYAGGYTADVGNYQTGPVVDTSPKAPLVECQQATKETNGI